MAMRIGLGFPTAREGQTYPVGYVRPRDLVTVARRAEELGYYSLWGNDHLTTPPEMRGILDAPANFYEPVLTFAMLAGVTQRLRFMLSVVVLPQRDPLFLAKQIATLDVLSEGRVMLGLGIGGYRDEIEAVRPDLKGANRSIVMDESLQALRLLFDQPRSSFSGRYVRFEDVDIAPAPVQRPFPLLLSATGPAGLRRVARLADHWVAAAMAPAALMATRAQLDAALIEQSRKPADVETHVQTWLSFGRDRAEAVARLLRSQHLRRTLIHQPGAGQAAAVEHYRAGNLLGTPDDVVEQVRAFEQAGVSHLGVVMIGDSMDELVADMEVFAERVLPAFHKA
jgi:probable F420-dependent oxidoreductase